MASSLSILVLCGQTISTLLLGSLTLAIYYVIYTIFKCRQAASEFTKKSHGLPLLEEGASIFVNHGVSMHLSKNVCQKITNWHEQPKYGKTFGWLYGPRACVSTIDLDLIKLIVQDEQQVHTNRMPMRFIMRIFEEDEIFLAEDEQWRRIRRAFAPGLKKFKTKNMVAEFEGSLANLVAHLETKLNIEKTRPDSLATNVSLNVDGNSIEIEVNEMAHRYSLDIVFRCLYKQDKLIDYSQARNYWTSLLETALRTPIERGWPMRMALTFPIVRPLLDWLARTFTPIGVWTSEINEFIAKQTRQALETRRELIKLHGDDGKRDTLVVENFRFNDGSEYKRFVVDNFIDSFLDGKISKREYVNTSFFLFNAADKTVGDTLSRALYYLAVNQTYQMELRRALTRDGLEANYLAWIINETLRLHSPAAIGCSRTIKRNIEIPGGGGRVLPAGTFVLTPLNTIHRLSEFWGDDAHEFKPERWRDTSHHHPMQFLPFGAGLRVCPGRELAMFEMKKFLATLVEKFKFSCAPKDDIDTFDSPYMLYTLPNSFTFIKVTKN